MSDFWEKVDLFGPEFEKNRERQKLNDEWIKGIETPKENWLYLQDAVWDLVRHSPSLTEKDREVLGWIDTVCVAQRDRCRRERWNNRLN